MEGSNDQSFLKNIGETTRPLQYHLKREPPKINGSVAGFIAVIVCLVVIILVSCAAIYYLLREQKIFDEEHGHLRTHTSYSNTSSRAQISSPETFSDRTSLSTRLFKLFRPESTQHILSKEACRMSTRSEGWMQTRSGDEWDFDPDPSAVFADSSSPLPTAPLSPPVLPMPVSRTTSTSNWSVRFDLNAIRGTPSIGRGSSPQFIPPRVYSPPSSPPYSPTASPIPTRALSPTSDPIPPRSSTDGEIRQFSMPSGVMQTLPGGTKFIEGL